MYGLYTGMLHFNRQFSLWGFGLLGMPHMYFLAPFCTIALL